MANFDDLIKSARLPEDSVAICLRGDLQLQHEELERQLQEVQEAEDTAGSGGLVGAGSATSAEAKRLAEEIEALEAEMRQHTHHFAFRGLPRKQYRDLLVQHPPREGNDDDLALGANGNTFPLALIAASCIDPVMTLEQVEQLAEVLTDGQVLTLFGCAAVLNRVSVDVPKSAAASAILARHAPRSRPPAPGASPGGGSSAGSLAG
jgi:hypothetical protein